MKRNKEQSTIFTFIFVCISCVLFLSFAEGIIRNPSGPQRLVFFRGMGDFFADFFNVLRYIAGRDPYFDKNVRYGQMGGLPIGALILYPFSKLDNFSMMTLQETWNSKMGLMSAFLFIGFSVFLLFSALNKIIKKYSISPAVLISLVLSSVCLFSVERGNSVILSAAFISIFICYYDSDNKYERILASISLAFAATMKIYPVLFGFLYFEKKQYRDIFVSAIITIFLAFFPFLFFKRGFANIPRMIELVFQGREMYNFTKSFPRFSVPHLIYKILITYNLSMEEILKIVNLTRIITVLFVFVSIIFSCLIHNKWQNISLLSMVVLFFPVSSGLYCGLYLFPVIIIFFATLDERPEIFNIFTMIVFIIFINPYQIMSKQGVSMNYILVNIALLTLWIVLLIYSGRQIIASKIIFTIKADVTGKIGVVKNLLFQNKRKIYNIK